MEAGLLEVKYMLATPKHLINQNFEHMVEKTEYWELDVVQWWIVYLTGTKPRVQSLAWQRQ